MHGEVAPSNFVEKEHYKKFGIFWATFRDFLSSFSGNVERLVDRATSNRPNGEVGTSHSPETV